MAKHLKKRPRWIFRLQRLKTSHLEEMSDWVIGRDLHNGDSWKEVYKTFRNYYHHLWHSRWIRSWVMTINRRPVFCFTLTRVVGQGKAKIQQESGCDYQLFLLPSPRILQNDHKLMLAWHAASIYVFFKLGLTKVQVTLDASREEENDALVMLGYLLAETSTDSAGSTNLYVCTRDDFKLVL